MKKVQSDYTAIRKNVSRIIMAMAFPLILEFVIALPLLSLHMVGGGTFWGLGALITVSGAIALVLGAAMSAIMLIQPKKYFIPEIRALAYIILALTLTYIVLISLMLVDFLRMY